MSVAQRELASGLWEAAPAAFNRRSLARLVPTGDRLSRELQTLGAAHYSLFLFQDQQRQLLSEHHTLQEVAAQLDADATAQMMVRFDGAMRRTSRSVEDYLALARRHLLARSEALVALAQGSQGCSTPESLHAIGVKLARAQKAERKQLEGLMAAWRDTAVHLGDVADVLVDGGLLARYLHQAAASAVLNATRAAVSALEASLLEGPLRLAFKARAHGFVEQVDRAFDLSQFLARMWADAFIDPPVGELQDLRASWGRVQQAARELQASRQFNMLAVLGSARLQENFAVPPACQSSFPKRAILWRVKGQQATLLQEDGSASICDTVTGNVSEAPAFDLGDLGIVLSKLAS